MDTTFECPSCGERVTVSPLDGPVIVEQTPADDHTPRRTIVFGGHSHWVLHRCDVVDLRAGAVEARPSIDAR
jgi:hypothetical protein